VVSDQQHSPVLIGCKLTAHNGLDTHLTGCLDKIDQPVESVGIGEGESIHALVFGGLAEFFNGADTPTPGIVGMDIEMDKRVHSVKLIAHRFKARGTR